VVQLTMVENAGHRRPLSLALSCLGTLNANRYRHPSPQWIPFDQEGDLFVAAHRANYANLEEALPETELRRVAAAALHSFLCSGVPG
jgi:hypothetical protein